MKTDNLLTIITVTYNAEAHIEKTMQSVLEQAKSLSLPVEYLIQDGASQDATMKTVSLFSEKMRRGNVLFSAVSEKDSGIYDAMNKGLDRANGKWICFLNAGDTFSAPSALESISDRFVYSKADVLYADYYRINRYCSRKVHIPKLENLKNTMIFCHQAIFIRREVYSKERYNCEYHLVADFDLMLRLFLKGYTFEHINKALVYYDTDGISAQNMLDTYKEIYTVRKNSGVLANRAYERLKYGAGMIKRFLLSRMPQSLRWKMYRILKKKTLCDENEVVIQ